MIKIAVICGGPSLERGISLNSARSILDHLSNDEIQISPLYVDINKDFYLISSSKLYSNTPSDFDFKLGHIAKKLSQEELNAFLKSMDLVFPVIHGPFGEDGELQILLEQLGVPFVGLSSESCELVFKKHIAYNNLRRNNLPTIPTLTLHKSESDQPLKIKDFFQSNNLKRAVVKPSSGGSSIGVFTVFSADEAYQKCLYIFENLDSDLVIEPFFVGKEFTVVVFENFQSEAVALMPTDVEISYDNREIFDYRKKYLPNTSTIYHTYPRFEIETINDIRKEAERYFSLFKMKDFVRMDGWVTPDNKIYFTDFNPLCGLEQNSFLFKQSSMLGLTHKQTLHYLIKNACRKHGIHFPEQKGISLDKKQNVFVLFGGSNAEREVSLMSGTNVWLKLLQSRSYSPTPFLYDIDGSIWKLPYKYTLKHTVEEIYSDCRNGALSETKLKPIIDNIVSRLGIQAPSTERPKSYSLSGFIEEARNQKAFVFIAMHGGVGEDGTLQKQFELNGIPYNGSDPEASSLCMDKFETGERIKLANVEGLQSLPKHSLSYDDIINLSKQNLDEYWLNLRKDLAVDKFIIKPRQDGCSAGIIILQNWKELEVYCKLVEQNQKIVRPFTFENQNNPIEMPSDHSGGYIIEPYIETDVIFINGLELQHSPKKDWIELTVGVIEKEGIHHSLNPSITVAEGAVLSLEEKFQGGTGVNLTPPPESILTKEQTNKIKKLIEKTVKILGIENYARIDIFFNRVTENMIVIEANSLPGLTASTVIYHQGLAEEPPLPPRQFLENIITNKLEKATIATPLSITTL